MSSSAAPANQEPRIKAVRQRPPQSVSTMTPAQVARKRARDRLFQQTTRARTQEYIQRLEQEILEFRVTTALESSSVDRNALQELYSHNQRLKEELVRLQGLAASGETSAVAKIASVVPNTTLSASFDPPFENKRRPQSPAFSNLCEYHLESSPLSANVQLSASSTVWTAQPPQSYHIPTEHPSEWLTPNLWRGNLPASFDLPASNLTPQPAQATISYCHDFNCQCTREPVPCQRELLKDNTTAN